PAGAIDQQSRSDEQLRLVSVQAQLEPLDHAVDVLVPLVTRQRSARVLQLCLQIRGREDLRLVKGGTNDGAHLLSPFFARPLSFGSINALSCAISSCNPAICLRNSSCTASWSAGTRVASESKARIRSGSSVAWYSGALGLSMRATRALRKSWSSSI